MGKSRRVPSDGQSRGGSGRSVPPALQPPSIPEAVVSPAPEGYCQGQLDGPPNEALFRSANDGNARATSWRMGIRRPDAGTAALALACWHGDALEAPILEAH